MKHNSLFVQMRQRAAKVRGAPDVRLAALSHNQYAVACMMADRTEEAIESFLTFIETYRPLSTYEKDMDSNPILNVGFAYRLKGDLKSALDILTAGLKDRESVFGPMDSVSYQYFIPLS
ncbi:hypothetical protein BU24DRAFT_259053 [Aaosphaeria arxii CBS 175.79]|uniref:TPR-like protein n=1 Tax=Aaosphaeria arxii CBS 175.79 TaxID=1450172 RepID=A0A6A5XIM2_9PLEO|nr:uncharacterized protein BU24DRAFT_259053 [Aaosphaeria arxii CBS 175.79]KAF2012803.1 hypothetical protein BU24DRAFT_259053 [Aaosphaeria arxii CBS 175.79]